MKFLKENLYKIKNREFGNCFYAYFLDLSLEKRNKNIDIALKEMKVLPVFLSENLESVFQVCYDHDFELISGKTLKKEIYNAAIRSSKILNIPNKIVFMESLNEEYLESDYLKNHSSNFLIRKAIKQENVITIIKNIRYTYKAKYNDYKLESLELKKFKIEEIDGQEYFDLIKDEVVYCRNIANSQIFQESDADRNFKTLKELFDFVVLGLVNQGYKNYAILNKNGNLNIDY